MTLPGQSDLNQESKTTSDSATITVNPEKLKDWLKILQAAQKTPIAKKISHHPRQSTLNPTTGKKRGGPTKQAIATRETSNEKVQLLELALQEADATIMEHIAKLKSASLPEKATNEGGLKMCESYSEEEKLKEVTYGNDAFIDIESAGGQTTHSGKICSEKQTFAGMEDLESRWEETDPTTFHCNICGTGFQDQVGFFEHLKTHYEVKDKPKRPRGRPRKNPIVTEAVEQTDEKIHDLDFGIGTEEKYGRKEEEFNEEIPRESGEAESDPALGDQPCYLCGVIFSTNMELKQHLRVDHNVLGRRGRRPKYPLVEPDEDGTYLCPYCNKIFTHRNSLSYHMKTHNGERPHKCSVCTKAFFTAGSLKIHMRVHTGDRPFKCDECGRKFRQEGDLKYHWTSLHTDIRQFQCDYCDKSFARKYSLTVHRRVHTGERNYICEYCNKGFRASSYLVAHRKIHTGEKPHECPICQRSFRMRSDMKRHLQMHTQSGHDDPLDQIASDLTTSTIIDEASEIAPAVATIQDEETGMMMAIMPGEDGQMYAVPIQTIEYAEDQSNLTEQTESTNIDSSHIWQLMNLWMDRGLEMLVWYL